MISANKLLDIAYERFATHQVLDVLSSSKYNDTGFEHWIQTELLVALNLHGYEVGTKEKQKYDCDLIIGDSTFLEIRVTSGEKWKWYLIHAIDQHPNANMYFFVSQMTKEFREELSQTYTSQGLKFKDKRLLLDAPWYVAVAWRAK